MIRSIKKLGLLVPMLALAAAGCEAPPQDFVQTGYRGLAIEHNKNRKSLNDSVNAILARIPNVPPAPPALEAAPAGTWENVQVLGHLSEIEFNILMQAITNWVAPEDQGYGGCAYCHVQNPDNSYNYAAEDKYTKHVARSMLGMTQQINTEWTSHVQEDRQVNCWTCHQGNPVPTNYWHFTDRDQTLRHYLDRDDLRVQGPVAMAGGGVDNRASIDQTVYAYQLMTNMSNALGVNCTYCHNTARFADWSESSPQRVTALRGLRMVRQANMNWMVPLQDTWPDNRLGQMGDGPKIQCSTCHIGAFKPQYNNEASWGAGWRGLTEMGYPHAAAPAEGASADTDTDGGM